MTARPTEPANGWRNTTHVWSSCRDRRAMPTRRATWPPDMRDRTYSPSVMWTASRSQSWLDQGLRALAGADLVGGMIRFRVPDRRTAWTLLDIDLHVDQERAVGNGTALTGNLFVRRDLFDRAGGFDDSLPSHGDYEFVARCVAHGARLGYSPVAMVSHPTHDRATPFLKKIWAAHWSRAVRELRRGKPPPILQSAFIPVFGMARSRRSVGRSLRLDRRRLAANGVRARVWDDLRALPILYFVLPYVAGAARLHARRTFHAGR